MLKACIYNWDYYDYTIIILGGIISICKFNLQNSQIAVISSSIYITLCASAIKGSFLSNTCNQYSYIILYDLLNIIPYV